MSRVLEHGKYFDVRFKMTCPACGCTFVAMSSDFSDGYIEAYNDSENTIHICQCPECKMRIEFGPSNMKQINKALIEVEL